MLTKQNKSSFLSNFYQTVLIYAAAEQKIATSQFAKWNFYHERPPPQQYADAERCAAVHWRYTLGAHTCGGQGSARRTCKSRWPCVAVIASVFLWFRFIFFFARTLVGPGEKHQRRSESSQRCCCCCCGHIFSTVLYLITRLWGVGHVRWFCMALFIRLRWPEHIVTFAPLCIVSVVRCESNASFLQLTSAGRTLEIEKPNYSRLKNRPSSNISGN